MSEKFWVQGWAVAALPSVPEFLPNSLIIIAVHAKQPIHSVVKYVTGIGDVHSSLCREGGTQVTFWSGQGVFTMCWYIGWYTVTVGCRAHLSTSARDAVKVQFS